MNSKVWWTSKTLWVNVLAFSGLMAQTFFSDIGADWVSIEAGALGVVNIVLRLVTKQPIDKVQIIPTLGS
jgi:uncharacterized membrane protein